MEKVGLTWFPWCDGGVRCYRGRWRLSGVIRQVFREVLKSTGKCDASSDGKIDKIYEDDRNGTLAIHCRQEFEYIDSYVA